MNHVRAETAHGQQDVRHPVLPPKLDIFPSDSPGEPLEVWSIRLGERIPPDGPKGPDESEGEKVRGWIVIVVLGVWVMWVLLGGLRLVLTGDGSMLQAAPQIVMFPLGIVLGYYFAGAHQRATRKPSRNNGK